MSCYATGKCSGNDAHRKATHGTVRQATMQLLRRLMMRLRSWRRWRPDSVHTFAVPLSAPIYRDVTSTGVRVYSLCGSCGARLESSATLCDACAKRRSPSPPS
jgi:hypothetical protein